MTTNNGATPAPSVIVFHDNGQDSPHIGRWYTHYKTGVPASHLEQITGYSYKDLLNLFTRHHLELISNEEREDKFIQLCDGHPDHILYWYDLYKIGVPPREILLASCRKKFTELEQLFNKAGLLILFDEQLEENRARFREKTQARLTPPIKPPAGQPRPTTKPEKLSIVLATPTPPAPAVVKLPKPKKGAGKQKPTLLTPSQAEEIHRRYMNEEPMSRIAQEWHLPEHVLYYQFKKYGLPLRDPRKEPPTPKWTPEQLNELSQLYLSGLSLAKLEEKAGYSIKTLQKAFQQAGLPTVRPRTPKQPPPEPPAPAEGKSHLALKELRGLLELKQNLERVGCTVNITINITASYELKE